MMLLDVFAVIYKMNRIMITTTSIMNKENYKLILDWFCFEWSSGVLYTRSWSARREWGERTSFTLHTMGKTQKLVE